MRKSVIRALSRLRRTKRASSADPLPHRAPVDSTQLDSAQVMRGSSSEQSEFWAAVCHELDPLIAARRDLAKQAVVFFACVYGLGRVGHLFQEPLMMRSMFPAENYQVFAIHPPASPEMTQSSRYQVAFRDVLTIEFNKCTSIHQHVTALDHENIVYRSPIAQYLCFSYYKLMDVFFEHMIAAKPLRHTVLDPTMLERGAEMFRQRGIGDDQPVVVVHVRESGWANDAYHQAWRDGDIRTYLQAIKFLAGRGYAVIRIGDRSMRRLPDLGAAVIDAASNPTFVDGEVNDGLFDLYAIARSQFMIAHGSGPVHIAHALNTPALLLNAGAPWSTQNVNPHDLMLFKDYVNHVTGERMSFLEMSRHPLFDNIDFATPRHYGIDLEDSPPELITAAVTEIVVRLAEECATGPIRTDVDQLFAERIRQIQQERNQLLDSAPDAVLAGYNRHRSIERRHINFGLPNPRLARSYVTHNPTFLRP